MPVGAIPEQTTDIAIIGGGIIGASLLYHLSKYTQKQIANHHDRPLNLKLFEKSTIAGSTTALSCGTISNDVNPKKSGSDLTQKFRNSGLSYMSFWTVKSILELENDYKLSTTWSMCGALKIATNLKSKKFLYQEYLNKNTKYENYFGQQSSSNIAINGGYTALLQWYTPEKINQYFPHLFSENVLGGYFSRYSGSVDASILGKAFTAAAIVNGVNSKSHVNAYENTEVINVRSRPILKYFDGYNYNLTVQNLETDEIYTCKAKQVVYTTGVNPEEKLGPHDLLENVKGHILKGKLPLTPEEKPKIHKNLVVFSSDAAEYWNSHPESPQFVTKDGFPSHCYGKIVDGDLFFGGGREVLPKTSSPENVEQNYENFSSINQPDIDSIENKLKTVFNVLDNFKPTQIWSGTMPFTKNNQLILESKSNTQFFINGFGAHGVMYGPGTAKFVADWIYTGDKPGELDHISGN